MKYYEDYKNAALMMGNKNGVSVSSDTGTLSFTPYIDNNCSAACLFCSERLIKSGMDSRCGSPCPGYEEKLTDVLTGLRERNVFLSVSGKEPTESPDQLRMICSAAGAAKSNGLKITEAVMYTNLSGFCKYDQQLRHMLSDLPLSRIEFSRHHYDEKINDEIMNFRSGEAIRKNTVLAETVKRLSAEFQLKAVCVMQRSGVSDIEDIIQYISFARSMGVRDVVFRELAVFDSSVDKGATADYIVENRIELWELFGHFESAGFRLTGIKQGYYYFSFNYAYEDVSVSFEMSDYEEMEKHHTGTGRRKLIFYPDGTLCRNWNKRNVIEKR